MHLASRIYRKLGRLLTLPVNPRFYRRAILHYWPQKIVFLKQYGERRTGTNFLRAVLLDNYPAAFPLMHVLGDKHSPSVDFAAELEKTLHLPDAEQAFVTRVTLAAAADTTSVEQAEQQLYLQNLARPLTACVREGRLGFIISTKHPYPWAASLARYKKWMSPGDGPPRMNPEFAEQLREAVLLYNTRHRAWLDLHEQNEARSAIIRHEDLLENPHRVVAGLEKKFGLWRLRGKLRFPQKKVDPTFWDQLAPWLDEQAFNPTLYTSRLYEEQLTEELWDIVTNTIDWNLAACFGYEKTPLLGSKAPG